MTLVMRSKILTLPLLFFSNLPASVHLIKLLTFFDNNANLRKRFTNEFRHNQCF
jgi:hypothetical protein